MEPSAPGVIPEILEAASCRVYGIDRDETAVRAAGCLEKVFAGRLKVVGGRYGDMAALIAGEGVVRVDGVTLDVGVSSMQVDRAERGFSFRLDGPLDMRMGQSGPTAADLVNETPEKELADIIRAYGEEHASRRVARAIAAPDPKSPSRGLGVGGGSRAFRHADVSHPGAIDPATRTFQALRVKVNDSLGN